MNSDHVKCSRCGVPHQAIFMETGQGNRCAVDVFVKDGRVLALGSYGSHSYDGQLYEIVGSARVDVELGVVCDECMRTLVDSGAAVKVTDDCYFGLGAD